MTDLMFMLIFVGVVAVPWRMYWSRWWPSPEKDAALLVAFLAKRGASDVFDIQWKMNDFTQGRYNWEWRSERNIYALLRHLEADGAVTHSLGYYRNIYRLAAPTDRLIDIEPA